MKWTHVKTLLIVILIAVNGFLAFNIYMERNAAHIDEKTLENTRKVLSEKGIVIDADIKSNCKTLGVVRFNDIKNEISAIAGKLIGDCEYSENGFEKRLTNGDSYMSYDSSAYSVKFYNALITGREAVGGKASAYASEFFNAIGLPPTYYRLKTLEEMDGHKVLYAEQLINGEPVFGNVIRFTVCEDGIREITGKWFFGALSFSSAKEKDLLNALFALVDFYGEDGGQVTIKSLTQGFYTLTEKGIESITVSSAWYIETEAQRLIYNAVSGQIILL